MIDLYTAATPNGRKASIMLEELALPYNVIAIDLASKVQKEPWFLKLNPNGRIPVIVDRDDDDFVVFESGAILMYLAEKTGDELFPRPIKRRSTVIQWLMFQMAGIGPMQGQAGVFNRYAPQRIEYAMQRYTRETRRLYEVLETRLDGREYLAEDYSIADIAAFPWVHGHAWSGISIDGLPNVQAWLKRIESRPAVQRGMAVPVQSEKTDTDRVNSVRGILA